MYDANKHGIDKVLQRLSYKGENQNERPSVTVVFGHYIVPIKRFLLNNEE